MRQFGICRHLIRPPQTPRPSVSGYSPTKLHTALVAPPLPPCPVKLIPIILPFNNLTLTLARGWIRVCRQSQHFEDVRFIIAYKVIHNLNLY